MDEPCWWVSHHLRHLRFHNHFLLYGSRKLLQNSSKYIKETICLAYILGLQKYILRQNRIKTRFLTNKWKLIYFHDKSQKFQFSLKISTFFQKKLKTSIFLKIHLIITRRVFIRLSAYTLDFQHFTGSFQKTWKWSCLTSFCLFPRSIC